MEVSGDASEAAKQVYMCVADGVGSWRQYGVDPRLYAHRLVENARRTIELDSMHREGLHDYQFKDLGVFIDEQPISPLDVLTDAWKMTSSSDKVTGSSTICVATVDTKANQLSYSNLGDCGLMVVRHIDSEKAGYFRERQRPRHLRKNDLRIAYLSQQQLLSFNLPYQLGYSDIPEHPGRFQTPSDADTASIPIMPGDIIVIATDGLFDNVDLDEIVDVMSDWETEWFPRSASGGVEGGNDVKYRYAGNTSNAGSGTEGGVGGGVGGGVDSGDGGVSAMQALSQRLVTLARVYSLDKMRDSPFALLAKENDILWSGGMPDDTTVLVARVMEAAPQPADI
jgi:protein phosphatase PTC7